VDAGGVMLGAGESHGGGKNPPPSAYDACPPIEHRSGVDLDDHGNGSGWNGQRGVRGSVHGILNPGNTASVLVPSLITTTQLVPCPRSALYDRQSAPSEIIVAGTPGSRPCRKNGKNFFCTQKLKKRRIEKL
jgi:hypothetical protein